MAESLNWRTRISISQKVPPYTPRAGLAFQIRRVSTSPMSMANLQRMAQQMQQEMLRIQSELETLEVDGSAGGGVVKATVTGKQELVSVTIDPSAVDPADVDMLQDLVVAAVNDALRQSRQVAESKMAAVTGGMKIPGMGF